MAGNKQGYQEVRRDLHPAEGSHQAGYEMRDVNAWAVGKFVIGLVLLCILVIALVLGYFQYLQNSQGTQASGAVHLPPEPRLETTPIPDLKAMRDAEDQVLNSYAWVDQPKGVVRIPIAKAIDLLTQRGLPARPQNGVQSASDASVPTESGLGEKVQQPGGPLAGTAK